MKVLVTGSAGFIGHHLVKKLLQEGFQVVGIDSLNDYYDTELKINRLRNQGFEIDVNFPLNGELTIPNNKFYRVNIEDKNTLMGIFETNKFDFVVNLAAQAGVRYSITNPDAYLDSNIVGFLNILEACRKYPIKHLLYASSSSVYGLNTNIPFSESSHTDHPISLYATSKKCNELMAHTYSHLFSIPTTGLRFFTVYGPWGRPDMALFMFTRDILANKEIEVFNFGKMERDFTYIGDIVEGIYQSLNNVPSGNEDFDTAKPDPSISSAPYRLFNIGNSSPVKLMDFVAAIEHKTDIKANLRLSPIQAGDVPVTFADTSKLEKVTGYKPNTNISDGISKFVDWYRNYYKV